jgi:hypothetical protein
MKERLVELLKEMKLQPNAALCSSCPRPKDGERECGRCKLEREAEFLLANGVTIK